MILDLFAGPGGLDHGARLADHDTIGIELDPNAVATRRAAGLATIHGDVRQFGPADFPDADILAGGPPCQTFTVAGGGAGRHAMADVLDAVKRMGAREAADPHLLGDERTGLVLEPLRWIIEAADAGRPYRAVVLEQVQQVQQVWDAYAEVLRAEGYSVGTRVVAAEQYGVPQTRRRAVLVARRDGLTGIPGPTHQPWRRNLSEVEAHLRPVVSMGDTLPGRGPFTVISNYGTGGDPRNRGRRASYEPAFTVTGRISRFRVVEADGREQDRFSWSEAGRLQGFPADWPWSGGDIGQQVGNAVPPPLAAALVRAAAGVGVAS